MVSIIQDCSNEIAIVGLADTVSSGLFTLNIRHSCSPEIVKEVSFYGRICNRVLLGQVEHSCTDKTKLNLDVGRHPFDLLDDTNTKLFTHYITIYKNYS